MRHDCKGEDDYFFASKEKLDALIKSSRYNNSQLSNALGFSRGWLSQRAKASQRPGTYMMKSSQASKIADMLSCTLQDFAAEDEDLRSPIVAKYLSCICELSERIPPERLHYTCDLLAFVLQATAQDLDKINQVIEKAHAAEDERLRKLDAIDAGRSLPPDPPKGWLSEYLANATTDRFYTILRDQLRRHPNINDDNKVKEYVQRKYSQYSQEGNFAKTAQSVLAQDLRERKLNEALEDTLRETITFVTEDCAKLLIDYYIYESDKARMKVDALKEAISCGE